MRKKLLAVLLVLFVLAGRAQQTNPSPLKGSISGSVVDSLGHFPLPDVTVTLQQTAPIKKIATVLTDSIGRFKFRSIPAGKYSLLIESVGYFARSHRNVLLDRQHAIVQLNGLILVAKQNTLDAVTVTAPGKLIDNKLDKLVYNAERDVTGQSGVATDLLKKVPQISVDVDGNVELAGSSSIRFLINGKPSTAFGSNIADVLQSIPASQIKSIEVVTNPGAKYDAEGLGGVINIILKNSTAQGINGNLSLSAGTRMDNGSFNFNARKGRFGAHAFISGNLRPKFSVPSNSERTSKDTSVKQTILLDQQSNGDLKRRGFESGVGFDWSDRKKNSISGSVGYNYFGRNDVGITNQLQTTMLDDGDVLSSAAAINHSQSAFDMHNIDASLNYKHQFEQDDHELDISVNTSLGKRVLSNSQEQAAVPTNDIVYGNRGNNPGTENGTEVQVNYSQPFKKDIVLGVGGKFNASDISSNANVLSYQPATQSYESDPFLSNSLTYHQKVYAGYAELSVPLGDGYMVKAGGRYERTEIESYYSNAQQQVPSPGYNTFVPSIYFSKKLTDNETLKLSYSKRIERPSYGDLNPFINTSDPKNISTGNPYLMPQIGHRVELGYSMSMGKVGYFMASVFYRTSDKNIQQFIRYYPTYVVGDSTYTNVAVSTRENIGMEKNIGLSLYADVHVTNKLSLRSNVFVFHRHIINTVDEGYNSTSLNYRLNVNATYQFSSTLVAEGFGNFNSAQHEAQGKYPSFTTYSFAVRKQFWNKKGSLALTATNPFNNFVNQRTAVFGPNFVIDGFRQIPFRSFGLNFTWKFGKLQFKKEKEEPEAPAEPAA